MGVDPNDNDNSNLSRDGLKLFDVNISIRDCTKLPDVGYQNLVRSIDYNIENLVQEIRTLVGTTAQIELVFMGIGQAGSSELYFTDLTCSLADALGNGPDLKSGVKLFFMVTLKDDVSPSKKMECDLSSIEFSPHNNSCDSSSSPLPACSESINLPGGDPSISDSFNEDRPVASAHSKDTGVTDIVEPPAKRFVGLVNQAMTCYLNSLIQTLFMTPEFRNAIYAWDPSCLSDETVRCRSIPYQLQQLFLQLQFSNRSAVETTALTTSFGWDTSEVWEQHDVQELCRILLDALESAWRGTDKADFVDHLYQGKMEDYVQCLYCKHCSSRIVKYQDISLAIRSFDNQVSYGNLHDALAAFTKPEVLTDDNRYLCERCQEKRDACKGLRFQSFPRVITMQLKRFDFDYRFGNRVKLHDRIFFPNYINLDRYVTSDGAQGEPAIDSNTLSNDSFGKMSVGTPENSSAMAATEMESPQSTSSQVDVEDPDNGSSWRYELFSVLVHSGSASGGHYYAYIKNFDDGHFYCFNDRVVRRVGDEEIRLTYGSGTGSSAYSYSTSAYMLMYRLCDGVSKSKHFLTPDDMQDFPWLIKQIEEIKQSEVSSDTSLLSRANKYDNITMASNVGAPTYSSGDAIGGDEAGMPITVYYVHPDELTPIASRVRVLPTATLTEAAKMVIKEVNLDKTIVNSNSRCRLIPYNNYSKVFGVVEYFACVNENSTSGNADEGTDLTISSFKSRKNSSAFFLEILPPGMPFRSYPANNVTLAVHLVDSAKMEITDFKVTSVPQKWTLGSISDMLCQLFELPTKNLRMGVVERIWPGTDTLRHLVKLDSTLEREKLTESPLEMYVENLSDPEDQLFPFRRTALHAFVDSRLNSMFLNVTVKLNRPNIPIVFCSENGAMQTVSSQLVLADDFVLPSPNTATIDGYRIHFTFCKNEEDTIVAQCKADKRLQGADLAKALALQLGVNPETTVIWRDYGGHCEEQLRSCFSLEYISASSRLTLRAGRVLSDDENIINVYLMEDIPKRLGLSLVERFAIVLENGQQIITLKMLTAGFLKQQNNIECCVGTADTGDRRTCSMCSQSKYHLRLRRNLFGEPGRILPSSEVLGKDCEWSSVKEVFFDIMTDGPEMKKNGTDLIVKARHWHPSKLVLDNPLELCVGSKDAAELANKITTTFKIDKDNIEVATCSSSSHNVSLLDLHEHVRWHSLASINDIDAYPLMLHDDCAQFYLRDKTEELAQIDVEKRREMISQETRTSNGFANSSFSSSMHSSRGLSRQKEKSLKIYTHNSNNHSNNSSPPPQHQSPKAEPAAPSTTPTDGLPSQPLPLNNEGDEIC